MPAISTGQLDAVDCQTDPQSLAGSLCHLLFTAAEMGGSNVTPARTSGISLLDPLRLNAIRGLTCIHTSFIEHNNNIHCFDVT